MKLIRGYIRFADSLSERTGHFFSWFTVILVAIVCFDVITRYLFNESSVALQESEWHLFALIFLGGAAYTLKLNEHVRIDLFYSGYSARKKAFVNFIGSLLFLIPFVLIVIISSQDFVMMSLHQGETSPDAGGLPARYILKAFIPISFSLILLQGLALALRSLLEIIYPGETAPDKPANETPEL